MLGATLLCGNTTGGKYYLPIFLLYHVLDKFAAACYKPIMNPRIKNKLTEIAIANPGTRNRIKMAAGVVYRNRLIAYGINGYKTHPLMLNNGYRTDQIFLHAEVDALRNAMKKIDLKQLSKCEMYIVRVKRPNKNSKSYISGMAKPCEGCQNTIASFGIKKIYYTEDDQ